MFDDRPGHLALPKPPPIPVIISVGLIVDLSNYLSME